MIEQTATWRIVLAGLCLAGLVGCGSRTYPVNGTIVYEDGKPATDLFDARVTLESTDECVSAHGNVRRDATFTVSTFKKDDGAIVGPHRILITPPVYYGSESGGGRPAVLDPRYSDLNSSGLEVTIEPKTNDVVLKLQRPRRSQ